VKGLNATEVDNMIIGLPEDQEVIAYLVPFSVIGNRRHLDLLGDMLFETNKALSCLLYRTVQPLFATDDSRFVLLSLCLGIAAPSRVQCRCVTKVPKSPEVNTHR